MHRDEDDQRQRRRGLELAGRRLDARQDPGEIGGDEKDEQRAEQRQERPRVLADDLVDLTHDAGDDQLQHRLAPVRAAGRGGASPASEAKARHRDDRPGRHHRPGDGERAEMEQDRAGERRRGHHAVLRAARNASARASRKPRKAVSSGSAPSRAAKPEEQDRRRRAGRASAPPARGDLARRGKELHGPPQRGEIAPGREASPASVQPAASARRRASGGHSR